MKNELDQVASEIFTDGARVYSARTHILTPAAVDGAVNAFSRVGIELVAEDAYAGSLFLQSLPLAYDPANDRTLKRGRKMLGLNLAHLLPFYGGLQGTPSPDLLLLNRRGEPVTFSFFDSTVAPHGIVAGVSGSGKSVLANNLILSAARRGARVFVLDRGNSYRKLCEMIGGTYVAFDPKAPRSINPCGAGLDEEKKIFLTDIVCEMCSQGQRELTVKERSLVSRCIIRAFEETGEREVFIHDILRELDADGEPAAHDLAVCLEMFSGNGPYAGFFDRPCPEQEPGLLTVYELGEVAKRKDVASVLLMALIHKITDYSRTHLSIPKYLIVDEAWTLLRSATTASFLEDVLRTYRKLFASAIMVTQQVSDFEGRTGEAIRANAPNRLFLQQTPETVLAMEKLLDLSPDEKEILGKIRTVKGRFSEILVQSTETRGVARLVPDPLGYWLTTTDPRDNARLEALVRKHGDLRAALLEAAQG
jgi:conjugal transfer ATP-binding protein TraC